MYVPNPNQMSGVSEVQRLITLYRQLLSPPPSVLLEMPRNGENNYFWSGYGPLIVYVDVELLSV